MALFAIRKAVMARLDTSNALKSACPGGFKGAPRSDVESNADQNGGPDYPYLTVSVLSGEIETGLKGSTERAGHTLRILAWGRRGEPGEQQKLMDIGDLLGDLFDGWAHSETGLRWNAARAMEIEDFQATEGGPGLDALGADWTITVRYC